MSTSDVAIVGAGLAGLYAARLLREQGATVTVLEARERVGGKASSVHTPEGHVLDLGAQWVGPGQTRILKLIKALGLTTISTHRKGKSVYALDGGKPPSAAHAPPLGLLPRLDAARLLSKVEKTARGISLRAPWQSKELQVLDKQSFSNWLEQHVISSRAAIFLNLMCEQATCASPTQFSAAELLYQLAATGGFLGLANAEQFYIAEGAQAIAQQMAKDLGDSLHLSCPVQSVVLKHDEVELRTARGAYTAKQVILAVPLQLLPRLDSHGGAVPHLADIQDKQVSGRVIKSLLLYDRAWWRERGLSGMAQARSMIASGFIDGSPPEGKPGVLVALSAADASDRLRSLSTGCRQAYLEALVNELFGPPPTPVYAYYSCDWNDEPWSLGGFASHRQIGCFLAVERQIQQLTGPVHLAGSETATSYRGYMEGALQSGERAAGAAHSALYNGG